MPVEMQPSHLTLRLLSAWKSCMHQAIVHACRPLCRCFALQVVDTQTRAAEAKKEVVVGEEAAANEKAAAAKAIKDECEADLAVALPMLEAALKALDTLTKVVGGCGGAGGGGGTGDRGRRVAPLRAGDGVRAHGAGRVERLYA